MAEGGKSQTIKAGSEEDFELTCTPCGEDNIKEEAVKYCSECQEYLCTSCTKHHGRLKATRFHKLLDKNDVRSSSVVAKAKCRYHPDRDIEMYCSTHDMVYCTTCIATEHISCNGVKSIEDMSQSCVQDTEIQRLADEADTVQKRFKELNNKKRTNIDSLGNERSVIQENIGKVALSLIEHIKKLKTEITDKLASDYAKMERELESEISVASHMIQELESMSKRLKTTYNMDAGQQFVHTKLFKKTINDANKLHTNIGFNGTMSINFTENKDLISSVMTATSFGQIRTEGRKPAMQVQYKMKCKKEINVKVGSDKHTCRISDVSQLSDGTVIVIDGDGNNKVKRLGNTLSVNDDCELDGNPTAVCCIDKNEVAVKMCNNKIQFISVGPTLLKSRCITIKYGYMFGMAYLNGELWTSGCGCINVYSTAGTLTKSVDKCQSSKAIFETSSLQHLAVDRDTVIVADYSDGAVCLNKDGTVKRELRDSRLNITRGVCVSPDGTVFLSGYNSNNIVMFGRDGKCLGELVASDAGLKNPISMCYDKNKPGIIVTCERSDTIHIIDISE